VEQLSYEQASELETLLPLNPASNPGDSMVSSSAARARIVRFPVDQAELKSSSTGSTLTDIIAPE
jgi:hypothetical protein